MVERVHYYEPEHDELGLEIQAVLRADKAAGGKLRWCEPEPDGWEFDCYCAVAAAAYLFLKGEELAGLDPLTSVELVDWEVAGRAARAGGYRSYQAGGPGGHWWLEHSEDGSDVHIIDLNIGIDDVNDDYPYEEGTPRGFMMTGYKRPAGRALEIIRRVKATRTADNA